MSDDSTHEAEEVFNFLLGSGSLEMLWFGDLANLESGKFWWRKHLRRVMEDHAALRSENTRLKEEVERLTKELDEQEEAYNKLEQQLPEGMQHCTIVYKDCAEGHGWLTATNWVQHGCPKCERNALEKSVAALQSELAELKRIGESLTLPKLKLLLTGDENWKYQTGREAKLMEIFLKKYNEKHAALFDSDVKRKIAVETANEIEKERAALQSRNEALLREVSRIANDKETPRKVASKLYEFIANNTTLTGEL